MQRTISTILRLAVVVACVQLLGFVTAEAQTKKKSTKPTKRSSAVTKPATAAADAASKIEEKLDLKVRPGALEATAFTFPSFEEFTLENGMHVFVVENHEQPVVNVSMIVKAGDIHDVKGKEGVVTTMFEMLAKGTTTRTAAQIAETLDGLGASIASEVGGEATTVTASMLKKHADVVLTVLADEVQRSTFPADELEKVRQQYLAYLASQRGRPTELGQALARKVIYGMDHPLAQRPSEASVKGITIDDVKQAYSKYIMPNNVGIAFVGDVSVSEVKAWLKKHFASWKQGTPPTFELPETSIAPQGVYFIPRKGSVQSTVIVTSRAPRVTSPEFDAAMLLSSYLGGGFGSRLFATLRETHAWTYSPFAMVTRGSRFNRFAVGSEVRSNVTDSAIQVVLREVAKVGTEGPDEAALQRFVASTAGSYRIAFERGGTVAELLLNAWQQGRPLDEVKTQVQRIENVGVGDVQAVASQYMGMFDLRIVVVGDPSIRPKLERFGAVSEFTLDVEPANTESYEPLAMSISDLVAKHAEAIGGRAAIDAVSNSTYTATAEMTMRGQTMQGRYVQKQAKGDKLYSHMEFPVMSQTAWCDGVKVWTAMSNGPATEADAEESAQIKLDGRMFPGLTLGSSGVSASIKGKRGDVIVVDATMPTGRKERYSFDASTYLLRKLEYEQATPQGPLTIVSSWSDFSSNRGLQLPATMSISNPIYSLVFNGTYELDQPIDAATFQPPTK
jgi:zinc protease